MGGLPVKTAPRPQCRINAGPLLPCQSEWEHPGLWTIRVRCAYDQDTLALLGETVDVALALPRDFAAVGFRTGKAVVVGILIEPHPDHPNWPAELTLVGSTPLERVSRS
jgi:hypothetical protein